MSIPAYFKNLDAKGRCAVHAKTIVSMLARPEQRRSGTFGAQWYEEAKDTLAKGEAGELDPVAYDEGETFERSVWEELAKMNVEPREVALALANLANNAAIGERVATSNREVSLYNDERFKQGCPTHGVTVHWLNDGHGGVCDICDG